ncbi:MAG: hypothetical protein ACI3XR_00745 [Eubacteriales bacterium]
MKKTGKLLLTLSLALLTALSMVSCLPSDDPADNKQIVDGNNTGDNGSTASEKTVISETVCFEANGISVSAKEIVEDSFWGTGIKLYLENNSENDYTVSTKAVIVNNCMVDSFFVSEIAAGKKSNDTLYLSSHDLKAYGIGNIGQIEIYFYVFDTTNFETVYTADCVTITTSLYDKMDTTVDDAGYTLYEEDGIRIVGKYVDEHTLFGSSVQLYIENTSDRNITVSCDDLSVNGYMVTGFLSETVYKGKFAIGEITVLSSDLEENNITSIDEIELKFHIYDSDSYQTIKDTDPIRFHAT